MRLQNKIYEGNNKIFNPLTSVVLRRILDYIKKYEDARDLWKKIMHYHENPKVEEEVYETIKEEVKGIEEKSKASKDEEEKECKGPLIEEVNEDIRSSSFD